MANQKQEKSMDEYIREREHSELLSYIRAIDRMVKNLKRALTIVGFILVSLIGAYVPTLMLVMFMGVPVEPIRVVVLDALLSLWGWLLVLLIKWW